MLRGDEALRAGGAAPETVVRDLTEVLPLGQNGVVECRGSRKRTADDDGWLRWVDVDTAGVVAGPTTNAFARQIAAQTVSICTMILL